MNQKTYAKIAGAATFVVTARAIECRDHLDPPLRLAIDILEVFDDGKHHKSCEIAQYLMETNSNYQEKGLNYNTVCQVLQALRKGSLPLLSDPKKGWYFQKDLVPELI